MIAGKARNAIGMGALHTRKGAGARPPHDLNTYHALALAMSISHPLTLCILMWGGDEGKYSNEKKKLCTYSLCAAGQRPEREKTGVVQGLWVRSLY